ncbi:VOC family protein [Thalassococcus sp. S3]|uniref:VOC family protein n=1 Tax=Thalassococcus sp. S3 TaxID=2017482 RepID=UPI0010244F4A|nr:VOC family protein [Thalassococcus sp. S3]QBF32041.1 hypothetical protein CFI11_12525 [Thalassococcus sp. S3]
MTLDLPVIEDLTTTQMPPAQTGMDIRQIELVGADLEPLRSLFLDKLSFYDAGPAGPGTQVLRNGAAKFKLTARPKGDATAEQAERLFVERHGTAIRDLGFRVPNVAAVVEATRRAGGRVIRDHDVTDTAIVELYPGLTHSLSGVIPRVPAGEAIRSGFAARGIDHVAICLPEDDFETVVKRYADVFGLDVVHEEFVETSTTAMNSVVLADAQKHTKLVFMQPRDGQQKSQIQTFIENHGGAGVQHVAFDVFDIVAAARWLTARGIEMLHVPDSYYEELSDRVAHLPHPVEVLRDAQVLVDEDESGLLLQAFTRPLFERKTAFLELVERRGSTGFGSGNIRALFRAVEREMASAKADAG